MKVDRKDLLRVLKAALPGIESGNAILEGADTFIFNNGNIHSYNDNISVTVPFIFTNKAGENVSGALKAKDFYDLINRYSDDTLSIIPKQGVWIVKTENSTAELTLLESGILERVQNIFPDKIKWHDIPEKFIDGLTLCIIAGNRSVLSGIFASKNILTSTDEVRISQFNLNAPLANGDSFWISDQAAVELIKLNNLKKYCVSDSWIHFKSEEKIIFSCKRLAQEKYPFAKITALIESHKKEKGDIGNELPEKLMDAVRRASSLSQNIESFSTVRLTFSTDGIEVFSQRSSGKYTEKVSWAKPFSKEIKPVSIFVDYSMMENAIKYSKTFYLKKTANKDKEVTRIIFIHENGLQLVSTFNGEE